MKFADDLYCYWKDKPVSHFFFRGFTCDVFLINQGDEIWLIDTGVEVLGRAKRILQHMRKDGLDPHKITKVFLTHAHADHMNAVGFFDKFCHPTFYVHEADKLFFENGLKELLDAQIAQANKYHVDIKTIIISPRVITIATNWGLGKMPQLTTETIIHDQQIFKGSRYDLHVIHTPGHLPGHCCFWIPQLKTMFLGDLLDPNYDHKPPINLATSDYDAFVSSITKLLPYQAEYFCGAHTKKIYTGIESNHEQVTGTLKQLEFIKQRTIEILKQNYATGTHIKQFNGKFPKTLFQNVEPMAAGFAVIRSLMAQGKIRQDGERFYYIEK
jgi:glyoxylase-like metal-dependent hydrolase (beta-lactamase superfamily II)